MLHIDQNTQKYLFELDRNFGLTNHLLEYGIEKEIKKTFSAIQDDWDKHALRVIKGVGVFNNKLVAALSDPLPSKYKHKLRPINRKFPFMDGGELVRSYNHPQVIRRDGDNTMTLTISPEFTSDHASLTNLGQQSRKGGGSVHWLHWADRVFGDNIEIGKRHSSKVPNIRDVLLGYYS